MIFSVSSVFLDSSEFVFCRCVFSLEIMGLDVSSDSWTPSPVTGRTVDRFRFLEFLVCFFFPFAVSGPSSFWTRTVEPFLRDFLDFTTDFRSGSGM